MIHKRKITKHKRPNTIQQAFTLFREIACDLPTKPDPEMSQRQLQIAFEQSVEAYTRDLKRIALFHSEDAQRNKDALQVAMKLTKALHEWTWYDRIRFILGLWIPTHAVKHQSDRDDRLNSRHTITNERSQS
jgi:hypothetical protein